MAWTELELFSVFFVAVVFAKGIVASTHADFSLSLDVTFAGSFVSSPDVHAHVLVGDTSVVTAELVVGALFAATLAVFSAWAVLHASPAVFVSFSVALVLGVLVGSDALASDSVSFGDAVDTALFKALTIFFLDITGGWGRALVEAAWATPGAFVVAGASIDASGQVSVAVLGALVIGGITRAHASLVVGVTFTGAFLL